ncbi:hypothetical protein TNCV_1761051 [Trichonephila clavipes]|nr:hypothetical protein TNCV_1761051 [Trichonephila clavipes]
MSFDFNSIKKPSSGKMMESAGFTKLDLIFFSRSSAEANGSHTQPTVFVFVESRADLMLQNDNAVLRSVHRQAWLLVALLLSRRVFEPFFVWFARSLMSVLP